MNRQALEQPFAPAQIKQRRGRNGVLDYVEGHSVIARLNDALDAAWSFEVVSHEVREDEVLVLGRLVAAGVVKMQFGASAVTRDRETRACLSLGDDLKAAATDALKKCATFLGVGLHLYADRPLRGAGGRAVASSPNGRGADAPAAPATPAATPGSARRSPLQLTPLQLDTIYRIAASKGLAPGAVEAMSLRAFTRTPEALTRQEASALIKELATLRRPAA